MTERSRRMDGLVFEGESTPLLLRKGFVIGLVVAFVAFVVTYVIIAREMGLANSIQAEPFKNWVEDRGVLGPVVFILVMALSVLFAPIPNVPIFIAAGLAWGPVLGTAYSMAGMMLGSTMAFYTSRWLGRRHLKRLVGEKLANRVDTLTESLGGKMVFWARMIPVVNFDWISFIAGLTSIRFGTFFGYSFLGMLLPTSIAVIAGDSLGKDVRVTLALGGVWVAGIAISAAFFWRRHATSQGKAVDHSIRNTDA